LHDVEGICLRHFHGCSNTGDLVYLQVFFFLKLLLKYLSLDSLEISYDVNYRVFLRAWKKDGIPVGLKLLVMISRDLAEANLALQVDLHVIHAEIEFVNISCQLIIHQASIILGQS
jgi:hypothetical protein